MVLRYLYSFYRVISLFYYDAYEYIKNSGVFGVTKNEKLRYKIMFYSHAIEKGLSMSEVKSNYGLKNIKNLSELVKKYAQKSDSIYCWELKNAFAVILAYCEYHEKKCVEIDNAIKKEIDDIRFLLAKKYSIEENDMIGGYKVIKKDEYVKLTKINFEAICNGRYSIRSYSGEVIANDIIYKCIELAKKAPSACNRQSVYIYIVTHKEDVVRILNLQGGANGFIDGIDKVLIVCSDLNAFIFPAERNSAYFDSGLFVMNILYALTNYGIGSCVLQWWNDKKKEKDLRNIVKIDEKYAISCLIAIGGLKDIFNVAVSSRRETQDITKFL